MLIDINLLSLNNNLAESKTNKININSFYHSINNRKVNDRFHLNLSYHFFKANIFLYIDLGNHFFKVIKNLLIRVTIITNHNHFNKHSYLLIARHRSLQVKDTIRKIILIEMIIRQDLHKKDI